MLHAIVWGLIQGLTEFLPVSSSGHLVLVPAFLTELGVELAAPGLAISAVLHLGTLVAVLAYYRKELARMTRFRTDPDARRTIVLLAVGTLPVLVGLPLRDTLERFEQTPRNVAMAMLITVGVLVIGTWMRGGRRTVSEMRVADAVAIGLAQSLALIPGVSRSGSTIAAGLSRDLEPTEAANFAFLLGIPAIAGAGLLSLFDLGDTEVAGSALLAGFLVSAISGYLAISALLTLIRRVGLAPFAVYAAAVALAGLIVL